MARYIALIRKEEDTGFWVDVPDIPGCLSCGSTEEEALANFQEAIEFHIKTMKESGIEPSIPRGREEILATEEDTYLKACLVEVPV